MSSLNWNAFRMLTARMMFLGSISSRRTRHRDDLYVAISIVHERETETDPHNLRETWRLTRPRTWANLACSQLVHTRSLIVKTKVRSISVPCIHVFTISLAIQHARLVSIHSQANEGQEEQTQRSAQRHRASYFNSRRRSSVTWAIIGHDGTADSLNTTVALVTKECAVIQSDLRV